MKGSMDDLLRDTLRARAADPTVACLDPEMAAAFVDGTLPARARSGAEVHVADCARCQAVLAALVRSTPPPHERVWWRRPAVAWLAPLTVAATAVAIWINVPDSANAPLFETQREVAPPVESPPIPQDAVPTTAAPDPKQQQQSPIGSFGDARSAAADMLRARQAVDSSAKPQLARTTPEAPAGSVGGRPATPPSMDQRAARPPAAPQPAPADAAAQQTADRVMATAPVGPSTLAGTDSFMANTRARVATAVIVSSNGASQWRAGSNGQVQHSTDGGRTWQMQATGANVTPVGGSSPSASVCWLVGPGGLVLITTDEGQSWRRVPFPVMADLVAIRAANESTATVTTSDGRTFATSDGGASWRQ